MSFFTKQRIIWLENFLVNRFGIALKLEFESEHLVLNLLDNGRAIIFDNLNPDFYQFGTSNLNCIRWSPNSEGFLNVLDEDLYAPGLNSQKIFEFTDRTLYCHYDLCGLIFWCLNRLEEINTSEVDNHERYYFALSHAAKHGYIEYPIIDQWLDILKQAILKINPNTDFKEHKFEVVVTHDVDRPSRYLFSDFITSIRSAIVDLLKNKTFIGFYIVIYHLFSKNKIHKLDPYNSFTWLMDVSEKNSLKSRFYFICGGNTKYDADYDLDDQVIATLIQSMQNRGHEIGFHPSYNCYLDSYKMQNEISNLKNIIGSNAKIGGRMHYLRFKYPETLTYLESVGVEYDSTLGYADHIGFRCGTSFEYIPFNPVNDKILNIKILPLIVMEGTIYSYMDLSLNEKTLNRILALKKRCKLFNGNFTLLWHNSELSNKQQRKFYKNLISE